MLWQLFVLLLVVAVLFAWLARGYWVGRRAGTNLRRAIEAFDSARPELVAEFFRQAAESGKPRGLRWVLCDFDSAPQFAIDRTSGEIYALLQATIAFAAIEGGDMEDVAAVGNLRSGSGVFRWDGKRWTTDGRVVFNLAPAAAMAHYRRTLQPVVGQPNTLAE